MMRQAPRAQRHCRCCPETEPCVRPTRASVTRAGLAEGTFTPPEVPRGFKVQTAADPFGVAVVRGASEGVPARTTFNSTGLRFLFKVGRG